MQLKQFFTSTLIVFVLSFSLSAQTTYKQQIIQQMDKDLGKYGKIAS